MEVRNKILNYISTAALDQLKKNPKITKIRKKPITHSVIHFFRYFLHRLTEEPFMNGRYWSSLNVYLDYHPKHISISLKRKVTLLFLFQTIFKRE